MCVWFRCLLFCLRITLALHRFPAVVYQLHLTLVAGLQVTASSYVVCVTISAEAFNRHMHGRSIYIKQQVIPLSSTRACLRLLCGVYPSPYRSIRPVLGNPSSSVLDIKISNH